MPSSPLLARRLIERFLADDCFDLAAQMAFYFVLSAVPFFLVLAAIVGWLPSSTLWQSLVKWMTAYLPQGSRGLLFSVTLDLMHESKKFLSVGLLVTIWSASSGFVSLMEALTVAHGAKETRSFWKKRVIAIAATLVSVVFFVISFSLTLAGHDVATAISYGYRNSGLMDSKVFFGIVRGVANVILILFGMNFANYFLPNVRLPWRWFTPGTSFVVLTLVLAPITFDFYLEHAYSLKVYGALAGIIIFMVWIYIASLVVLIGAETDTAIQELTHQETSA